MNTVGSSNISQYSIDRTAEPGRSMRRNKPFVRKHEVWRRVHVEVGNGGRMEEWKREKRF